MLNIVITGASGFIGNNLIKNLSNDFNVMPIGKNSGYNMANPIEIDSNIKIDYFIHAAFQIKLENLSLKKYIDLNYQGVLNSLNFCKQNNIKYIFLSSYVYGIPKYLPINTSHPTKPHNDYAKIKLECEKLCKKYKEKYDLNTIILRLFNIYGKGQKDGYIFPDLMKQIKNKKIFLKNINSKRDFLHIDDLVSLIKKILIYNSEKYKILNVGSGVSTSIKEIIDIVKTENNNLQFFETKSSSENLIKDCYADIDELKKLYNWKPKISIVEGIKKIISNE